MKQGREPAAVAIEDLALHITKINSHGLIGDGMAIAVWVWG